MTGNFGTKASQALGFDKHRPHNETPDSNDTELYVETEPTVYEFLNSHKPTFRGLGAYFYRLFPFLDWIGKYNWTWFMGDVVAGVTVGAVVVPQSMAYAQLALLEVQYGLYSSFMGVLIYWFFATSKDITIGPVGVMSLVTGNVVARARETLDIPPHFVASALALITGCIITALGLLRLGWLVEFIPLPAICSFMTGGGLTVLSSQIPKILGIPNIKSRRAPYLVFIDTLKGLPNCRLDAAMGLSALFMLYAIRGTLNHLAKRYPRRAKTFFFINTLRTVFVILLYTGISAGVNINRRENPKFSILHDVPSGFQQADVPRLSVRILETLAPELPASVIVMLIEHISISKSFGRINNYTIDPSQELVAIGVTNIFGPFLGAYPATGSFSRTAIKSKAGVRTPFAGVITAIVVLLALYALTAVFYYIPDSSLGAVIFHAVGDVLTPPKTLWQFWRTSPLELVIFLAGVFVIIFTSIENGIYTTIAMSFVVLIGRLFLNNGQLLGHTQIRTIRRPLAGEIGSVGHDSRSSDENFARLCDANPRKQFFPLSREDGLNPSVNLKQPGPGVFIYRPNEGFNYPNANRYLNDLTAYIFRATRRTNADLLGDLGDRPWNDGLPRNAAQIKDIESPLLKAIILDFSSVNNIDVTAAQALIDVRDQLDRYAAPDKVEWHFACIRNRWTKRALAASGFGFRESAGEAGDQVNQRHVYSICSLDDPSNLLPPEHERKGPDVTGPEGGGTDRDGASEEKIPCGRQVPVLGLNRPFFHVDLDEALQAVTGPSNPVYTPQSNLVRG